MCLVFRTGKFFLPNLSAPSGRYNEVIVENEVAKLKLERNAGSEKLRVLIAEDDKHVLLTYKAGLKDDFFDMEYKNDGNEVLETFKEGKPDILILDIMLPGMSGYAILKAIREDLEDKTATIVMVTSLSDREDVIGCMKLGIQGYIVKPFSRQEIAGKVLGAYQKTNPERAAAILASIEAAKAEPSQA
jgi:DNA-binding response OmpR family regulator